MHENEVYNSNLSSISSQNESFGDFQRHTRGIGSKLLMNIDYEGKGLGKHAQGMVEPIVVEQRPRYLGLGYGQNDGEFSKAKETHEGVPRSNFITSSLSQACDVCVHEECKSFISTLQEGAHKHATSGNGKQEDVERSKFIETIVDVPKRDTTSLNSPPQEGDKGECARYKYAFNQVSFDYDKRGKSSHKIWRDFTCFFLWFE